MNYYGYNFIRESDLAHHGILGMKWGIRRFQNKDGTLTNAGKKRYQDTIHRKLEKARWDEDVSTEVFEAIGANKSALRNARQALEESFDFEKRTTEEYERLFSELEQNRGTRIYYDAVAEIASYNAWKPIDDLTVDDISGAAFMGAFEDGGQSLINAYSMYAYKKGIEKQVSDLYSESIRVLNDSQSAAEKYIDSAFESVGMKDVTAFSTNPNYKASSAIVNHLINSDYSSYGITKGSYLLDYASHASSFSSADKEAISKAEKIASHLGNAKDSSKMAANTWYLLRQASENLGLLNIKASELSQADWNRINAEIRRLRN